jgi:hypothetical protein
MNSLTSAQATLANNMCPVANTLSIGNRIMSLEQADIRGSVFYVDSVNGAATNGGTSWSDALTTISAAIALCTDNKGDVIKVAPFHQEVQAVAGNLFSLTKAGITIIGVSNGAYNALVATGASTLHNRPTLILDHADATIAISAPNCRISGFLFVTDVADVVSILTPAATADGLIIDNNVFRDNATNLEYLVAITLLAATPNVQIIGNKFYTTAAGGTANAILSAANTGLVIKNNYAFGAFSTGVVLTSAPLVGAEIVGNILINSGAIAIALNGTTSTGVLASNFLAGTTSQAAALTGDNAMFCFENYINDTVGSSGLLNPAADS